MAYGDDLTVNIEDREVYLVDFSFEKDMLVSAFLVDGLTFELMFLYIPPIRSRQELREWQLIRQGYYFGFLNVDQVTDFHLPT